MKSACMLLYMSLFTWLVCCSEAYVDNSVTKHEAKVMTCWTCPKKDDNEACNQWASDRRCPKGYTVCQTVHKINTLTGKTMLVHKRCALPSECKMEMIGCHNTNQPGIQDCISCCASDNCNEHSPNQSVAVQNSLRASSGSQGSVTSTSVLWTPNVFPHRTLLYVIWYATVISTLAEQR